MKTITLLSLSLLGGVSCAQTAPPQTAPADVAAVPADVAAVPAGAVKAKNGGLLLVSAADISRLRANKAAAAEIIKIGTKQLNYVATPAADMAPAPHYDAKGVSAAAKVDAAKSLSTDAVVAYRAALCYLLTDDVHYAANAQRIIDAWSTTLTQVSTRQGKFNVSSSMPFMIIAASWVRGANGWDSSAFEKFLRDPVLPASQSDSKGNHGFWGVLMDASAHSFLGDQAGIDKDRARWDELLKTSVEAGGGMPEEYERSGTSNWRGGPDKGIKGISYTHYALLPASLSAKIFADQGQKVWQSESGKLLKAAFDKSASWTRHPETFPYYASNDGKLVSVRNAAYFALLQNYFPNKEAEAVLNDGEQIGLNGFYLLELFGAEKPAQ